MMTKDEHVSKHTHTFASEHHHRQRHISLLRLISVSVIISYTHGTHLIANLLEFAKKHCRRILVNADDNDTIIEKPRRAEIGVMHLKMLYKVLCEQFASSKIPDRRIRTPFSLSYAVVLKMLNSVFAGL
jgi:hypothetical protein